MDRSVHGIVATTDFHSSLRNAPSMVEGLTEARPESVIVDCGDFFEGTWFYTSGNGEIETEILLHSYDFVVPGNHGWLRYLESEVSERTVCVNVLSEDGQMIFAPFARAQISGRRVGIVGIIGFEAFEAIPRSERGSASWVEPVAAIRALRTENADIEKWCVVSHAGVKNDVEFSRQVEVDIIFSGHCHSVMPVPRREGRTWITKGEELGVGYASAELVGDEWQVRHSTFDRFAAPEGSLSARIEALEARGAEAVAIARPSYQNAITHSRSLIQAVAERVASSFDAAVLLNGTAIRDTLIEKVLSASTLADIEPFGNTLVETTLPDDLSFVSDGLERNGMLPVCVRRGHQSRRFITTAYLADAFFPSLSYRHCGALVDHVLAEIGE